MVRTWLDDVDTAPELGPGEKVQRSSASVCVGVTANEAEPDVFHVPAMPISPAETNPSADRSAALPVDSTVMLASGTRTWPVPLTRSDVVVGFVTHSVHVVALAAAGARTSAATAARAPRERCFMRPSISRPTVRART